MKRMLKGVVAVVALTACAACTNVPLEGVWLQPVPGMPDSSQGFTLNADGTALSLGMATLSYESWKKEGDKLVLTGKSLGNGQTIAFADTLVIEKLTSDSLCLRSGDLQLKYARATEADAPVSE